jgi:hypothetical protein
MRFRVIKLHIARIIIIQEKHGGAQSIMNTSKGQSIMDTPMGQSTVGEMLPLLIILGVLLLLIIFCFRMVVVTSKTRKAQKQEHKKLVTEKRAVASGVFSHTVGLPISENTFCTLYYCPTRIEIIGNGTQFNLDFEKINDISMKTSVDIHRQYVSSAAGAVGGALLFGAVGSLIGGRVKEKQLREVHTYLIFTYSKESNVDYIAFDVTNSLKQAGKFVDEFRKRPKKVQSVTL